jgi:hypothetical protein
MRKLLLLSAGLALAACTHKGEETGAAPDRGRDTTAVTQGDTTAITYAIDSTRTGPPGVAGRPPGSTVTPDSAGVPSQAPRDTTLPGAARDTGQQVAPQDTSAPGGPGQVRDSVRADTTGAVSDTTQAPRQ